MRLAKFLLAALALAGGAVEAGSVARGPEALYMYSGYRMDVDVSVAEAEKEGKTRAEILKDPPWKMAAGLSGDLNEDADWGPDGKRDESKYGMNFHSFCKYTNNQGYGREVGREKIADPWNPTIEEVKNIARWEYDANSGIKLATQEEIDEDRRKYPDPRKSKIPGAKLTSFNGFSPQKLFKGLPMGDWANQLQVAAELASKNYEKNPEVAGPHYDKMIQSTRDAQVARKIDSGDFQKTRVWQMVEAWKKLQPTNAYSAKIDKGMIKEKSDKVKASESAVYAGDKYNNVDPKATLKALQDKFGAKSMEKTFFTDLFTFLKSMAKDFEAAKTLLAGKAAGASGNSAVAKSIATIDNSHQKVVGQLKILDGAMTIQRGKADGTRAGCGFPDDILEDKKRSPERWLRVKRRATL